MTAPADSIGARRPARVRRTASGAGSRGAQEPTRRRPDDRTTGEATIRRAPDQAFVTLAVETRARMPRDAQQQNADAMTAVQQQLTTPGMPKDAMRTTGYSIQQEFDFTNGRRVPREYVARNGVEIRLDGVERVGEIARRDRAGRRHSVDRRSLRPEGSADCRTRGAAARRR